MRKSIVLILILSVSMIATAQDKKAYQLYSYGGVPVTYNEMLEKMKDADVIFFGELHNNPISHWLQLELTEDLFENNGKDLILAAEMFESDNQLLIDEYLSGLIPKSSLWLI